MDEERDSKERNSEREEGQAVGLSLDSNGLKALRQPCSVSFRATIQYFHGSIR